MCRSIVICVWEGRKSEKVREGKRKSRRVGREGEEEGESERSIWPTSPAGDIRSLARVLVIIGS